MSAHGNLVDLKDASPHPLLKMSAFGGSYEPAIKKKGGLQDLLQHVKTSSQVG